VVNLGVAEHAGPFSEGEIGGDDDGGALVEPADEVEQKLAAGLGKGQMPSILSLTGTGPRSNNGDDPMARSQQDLVHITRYGGGFDISAKDHTQDNSVQLAQNTAAGKGTLILRDIASKSIGDLVNIAASAPGRVIFVDP
jgi:hypothetical protein